MGVSVLIFSILNFRLYPTCFKHWLLSFMVPMVLSDWKNFFMVISSGAFTSSIVTLLISIAEYRAERESALEDYIAATINFCTDFYNMEYLDIDIPKELLQEYYTEQWRESIKFASRKRNRGYVYNEEYIIPDSDVVTKIKEWIWNCSLNAETRKIFEAPCDKREYLDAEFADMIHKYDEEMDTVIKQYINLSDKINTQSLTSTIGRINFLFGNKYRKEVLYKKMYNKNKEIVDRIHDVSSRFGEYHKNSKGNKLVILRFIQEIQDYIFSVEERKNGYDKIVYNQYLFEMNCEIDNALRKLYGKKRYHGEPPKKKDFIAVSFWRNTDEFI